jgi:ribonucleoside-diphosphate reductase alpha chain
MTAEINSKIVGYTIKKDEVQETPPEPILPDVDPLTARIERRPDGSLEAVSEKVTYIDADGRHRLYVLVSFIPVHGHIDGKAVSIERPIEFFIPSGQLSSEHQWITATMRNLSLAARGGYITQALQDLRKVAWDKGPVRCGKNEWGKPVFHDSVVAAVAWSIQQILFRRGFLNEHGGQISLEKLIEAQTAPAVNETQLATPAEAEPDSLDKPKAADGAPVVGSCGTCGGDLHLMDGCPTCLQCGWSKCG